MLNSILSFIERSHTPITVIKALIKANLSGLLRNIISAAKGTKTEWQLLKKAFTEIVKNLKKARKKSGECVVPDIDKLEISPSEAFYADSEYVELENSENRISVKTVTVYPPGVPVRVPGVKVNKECIEYLKTCYGEIIGIKDGKIKVIKEG